MSRTLLSDWFSAYANALMLYCKIWYMYWYRIVPNKCAGHGARLCTMKTVWFQWNSQYEFLSTLAVSPESFTEIHWVQANKSQKSGHIHLSGHTFLALYGNTRNWGISIHFTRILSCANVSLSYCSLKTVTISLYWQIWGNFFNLPCCQLTDNLNQETRAICRPME